MPKKITEYDRGFAAGVAIACGVINSCYDQPGMVSEALGATGFTTRAKMKRYGVEDYDLDLLRPAFAEFK